MIYVSGDLESDYKNWAQIFDKCDSEETKIQM